MALKSDAAAEKPKNQLSRNFGVVGFSTFATVSSQERTPLACDISLFMNTRLVSGTCPKIHHAHAGAGAEVRYRG